MQEGAARVTWESFSTWIRSGTRPPAATRHASPCATVLSLLMGIPVFVSGCGPASAQREVTGTVTLDGARLESGTITLTPIATGRSAGGKIVEGKFTISREKGPEPGEYDVKIVSRVGTGNMIPNPNVPGDFAEEVRNIIPTRYNARTELRIEITADGKNNFDFPLESEPRRPGR